jgi:hypothetical protein
MYELFYDPSKLTMTVVGILMIVKALYLIFLTNLQNTSGRRAGMFRVLWFIIYFIFTPALLLVITSCLFNNFIFDEFITLDKIYWKIIIIVFCIFCFIIYYFNLIRLIKKAVRFFKKKDLNETKYQSIFKRTRSLIIILILLDIILIGYLNYIEV